MTPGERDPAITAALTAALSSSLHPLAEAARRALDAPPGPVVLVEGLSDEYAVEELAARRAVTGVLVVPMQGATNLTRFLAAFGRQVLVLCDAREAQDMRRRLRESGVPESVLFVCADDLEDELIRALGPPAVQAIVDREGDLRAFQSLQRQPEWRGRPEAEQLRRFFGAGSGRKIRYGRLLAAALRPPFPEPLEALLSALEPASSTG